MLAAGIKGEAQGLAKTGCQMIVEQHETTETGPVRWESGCRRSGAAEVACLAGWEWNQQIPGMRVGGVAHHERGAEADARRDRFDAIQAHDMVYYFQASRGVSEIADGNQGGVGVRAWSCLSWLSGAQVPKKGPEISGS